MEKLLACAILLYEEIITENEYQEILDSLFEENPDEVWNMSGCMNIKVQFSSTNFFAIYYPQNEIYGLDEKFYDLSLLKPFYDKTMDFHEVWDKEKICPNPRMYEVEHSQLKEKLNVTDDTIKHWLIVGHEEEIHILAKVFIWYEE